MGSIILYKMGHYALLFDLGALPFIVFPISPSLSEWHVFAPFQAILFWVFNFLFVSILFFYLRERVALWPMMEYGGTIMAHYSLELPG